MPVQHDQHGSGLMARVRLRNERRALQQAKLVPWKTLAATAEQYTDWEVFTLWLRAVVDAARHIPTDVARELESRAPLVLEHIRLGTDAVAKGANDLGGKIWQAAGAWAEMNIFLGPKREGWLDAVQYFSSSSLRSMKAWSHWESVDKQWGAAPPNAFPNYVQWQSEVAALTRLSDGNSLAQQVLETVHSVPEAEWTEHLLGFSDLVAFSLWMELVLDIEGSTSSHVARELADRYRGFRISTSTGSKEAVRALHQWVSEHRVVDSNQEELLAALSFHVRNHPAYPAMRRYAQHCHDLWPTQCPDHLPSFDEWREAADGYFERVRPYRSPNRTAPASL
jgi:hypothetical protein